ncbi:MAG: DsbA family protein, partial [Silicimonas sp.]|nr:DsbA family protein [Silicimonas sp.]
MLRRALIALAALAMFTLPAAAFEIDQMTDNERAIFRAEIREYLLENPEVLMEAIGVLEERRAAEAVEQELLILSQYSDQIYNDGYS